MRFTGKAYVLPSRGQQGIPVVTINTDKIDVEIYRIGDRSLATELSRATSTASCRATTSSNLSDRTGTKVYEGRARRPSKLNAEVTTAFPVSEASAT